MLLVYVPAGMVLVGAASGVSRALEQGLYARILRWLTHDEPPSEEPGAAPNPNEQDPSD